jgi:hypothetical protein
MYNCGFSFRVAPKEKVGLFYIALCDSDAEAF